MILDLLFCLVGLVLLVFAADHFVLGASRLATAANLSPIVIGAVIMGFGTSLPELLVSSVAAGRGELALGTGNIIGSNVANLSLVLGAAALVARMDVARTALRREALLAVGATAAFGLVAFDDEISRVGGLMLAVLLVAVITLLIRGGQLGPDLADAEHDDWKTTTEIARAIAGLVGTLAGAQLLVSGSTSIAERYGLSGGFVGFSLVALGTSLPELATTLAAARRGETQMIFGNLFGSNIFNSLAVGGAIGLVGPGIVGDAHLTTWGVGMMLLVSAVAFGLPWLGFRLSRSDGVILLTLYVSAMAILGIGSRQDDDTALASPATTPHHALAGVTD